MSSYPLISVVVPTRDRPELVRRAVASILQQEYPGELECLVVFDQSEPVAPDVAVPRGRQLRLIVNDRTPGLAGARNTGVLASSGGILGFCDDDDEWLRQKARLQVDALRRNPANDVVACGMYVRRGRRRIVRLPPQREVTFQDLLRSRRMEIHPGTILVRRDAFLNKIGLVDEEIPGGYAEDYEWMLRAARLGDLVTIPEPLAQIDWGRSSWFVGRWELVASALRYLLEKYPEFEQEPIGLARIYGQISFALAASGDHRVARDYARRCLRLDVRQPRAYLAFLVSLRILPPRSVVHAANMLGRGI